MRLQSSHICYFLHKVCGVMAKCVMFMAVLYILAINIIILLTVLVMNFKLHYFWQKWLQNTNSENNL